MEKKGKTAPQFSKNFTKIPNAKWIKELITYKFELSDGKSEQWEAFRGSDTPTILLMGLTHTQEIILIHQYRFPTEEFCYELPGGMVEQSESIEEAVKREFLEETGFSTEKVSKLCCGFLWNGKSNEKFEIWLGLDCIKTRQVTLDSVETLANLTVEILSIQEIKKRISEGDVTIDPPISHGILALEAKRII